jgi:hypothetical protein
MTDPRMRRTGCGPGLFPSAASAVVTRPPSFHTTGGAAAIPGAFLSPLNRFLLADVRPARAPDEIFSQDVAKQHENCSFAPDYQPSFLGKLSGFPQWDWGIGSE